MLKSILVANDKATIRSLVREYLKAEGFRVITALTGAKRSMPPVRKNRI